MPSPFVQKIVEIINEYENENELHRKIIGLWATSSEYNSREKIAKKVASTKGEISHIITGIQRKIEPFIRAAYEAEYTAGQIYKEIIQTSARETAASKEVILYRFIDSLRPKKQSKSNDIEKRLKTLILNKSKAIKARVNQLDWSSYTAQRNAINQYFTRDIIKEEAFEEAEVVFINDKKVLKEYKAIYKKAKENIAVLSTKKNSKNIKQKEKNINIILSLKKNTNSEACLERIRDSLEKICFDEKTKTCDKVKSIDEVINKISGSNEFLVSAQNIKKNIYASDLVEIKKDLCQLFCYEELERIILSDNVPQWIIEFCDNTKLDISNYHKKNYLENKDIQTEGFCDALQNFQEFNTEKEYKKAYKIYDNYLEPVWDEVYDNFKFFVTLPSPNSLFKLCAYTYLKENFNSIFDKLISRGNYCYQASQIKDKNYFNTYENKSFDQLIDFIFDFMELPNSKNYEIMYREFENCKQNLKIAEVKDEITKLKENSYYLGAITRNNRKSSNQTVEDILDGLLGIFHGNQEKKWSLTDVYDFGISINKDNIAIKKKTLKKTKTILANIFLSNGIYLKPGACEFKQKILSEARYNMYAKAEPEKLPFVNKAYEYDPNTKQRILKAEYCPGGKYFSETVKVLELPKIFLAEQGNLIDELGQGCYQYLESCDHFVNYVAARLYDPLNTIEKKAERICELFCCYSEDYKSLYYEN